MLFDNQKQTGGKKKHQVSALGRKKHQVNALGLILENSKVLGTVLRIIMFLFLSERSSNSKRSIEGEMKPTLLKWEFHLFFFTGQSSEQPFCL